MSTILIILYYIVPSAFLPFPHPSFSSFVSFERATAQDMGLTAFGQIFKSPRTLNARQGLGGWDAMASQLDRASNFLLSTFLWRGWIG